MRIGTRREFCFSRLASTVVGLSTVNRPAYAGVYLFPLLDVAPPLLMLPNARRLLHHQPFVDNGSAGLHMQSIQACGQARHVQLVAQASGGKGTTSVRNTRPSASVRVRMAWVAPGTVGICSMALAWTGLG